MIWFCCIPTFFIFILQISYHREHILKLKDEYYKPRDLSEDDELENIIDAILKQKAMAMDTGYVADVNNDEYRFVWYDNHRKWNMKNDILVSISVGKTLLSFPKFGSEECRNRCSGLGYSARSRSWYIRIHKISWTLYESTHQQLDWFTPIYKWCGK